MLSDCVRVVFEALTNEPDKSNSSSAYNFLAQAFPRLLMEYFAYWMNPRTGHLVLVGDEQSNNHSESNQGMKLVCCRQDCLSSVLFVIIATLLSADAAKSPTHSTTETLIRILKYSSHFPHVNSGCHHQHEVLPETPISSGYLNRYFSHVTQPRFESQLKDQETVRNSEKLLQQDPASVAAGSVESVMQSVRAAGELCGKEQRAAKRERDKKTLGITCVN